MRSPIGVRGGTPGLAGVAALGACLGLLLGCAGAQPPPEAAPEAEATEPPPPPPPLVASVVPEVEPPPPAQTASGAAQTAATGAPDGVGLAPAPALSPPLDPSNRGSPRPRGLVRGVGDEADRLLALGDAALSRRDYERAVEHYNAARKKLPRHAAPIVGIVSARFGQHGLPAEYNSAPKDRRVDQLLGLLDQALALDPNYAPALIERAQLLLVKGRADAARDVLSRAAELSPNDAEVHSALAVVALASGDVRGALEGFSRAASLDPNNPSRLTNLGTTLLMNGDVSAAIGALERALSLAPDDPRTRGDLGTALLASGKPKAALPHLLRAHELAPERATFMSNLAYAHLQLDQLDLAEQWCKRAIEKDAKLGSAWINLGLVRVRLGDNPGAKQAFQRAQALDPSDPRPKANLQELQQLMHQAR